MKPRDRHCRTELPTAMRIPIAALAALSTASALSIQSLLAQGPTDALQTAQSWVEGFLHSSTASAVPSSDGISVKSVTQDGMDYTHLSHPLFPAHAIRLSSPKICDNDVKQYSGYLDIAEGERHLFFWFMESRNSPKDDPVVLWLNGGPGCSSTTGLLFELGACSIADKGENTTYNKHSWNTVANMLFLDQPIGVGYSYADSGAVDNTPAAAEDVYAFLALFFGNFDKYAKNDFHISGESYAGTYLPNIASTIYRHNLALQETPAVKVPKLHLKSVLIGNGLTDPKIQFPSVKEYACDSDYAVYDDPNGPECVALDTKGQRCAQLIDGCYKSGSRFSCVPAALYCWSQIYNGLQQLGLNMYDVRRKCDKSEDADGPLCYREMGWMETYLNKPEIKKELGVPSKIEFKSCNMQINQAFLFKGDGMHNSASLLPELVNAGIKLLIYAGEADLMCNWIGNLQWLSALETDYLSEFTSAKVNNFTSSDGHVTGFTKSAGKGSGNVAFVSFHEAGHMVPHDQPVASLDMFSRWLKNEPLAHGK